MPSQPALEALWHLPHPLLVLDGDMRLCRHNAAAEALLCQAAGTQVGRKCGEILRCLHSGRAEDCCGTTEHCPQCEVRNGVRQAQEEHGTVQVRVAIQQGPQPGQFAYMLVTAVGFEQDGAPMAVVMLQDIPALAASAGLVPVCAVCHKMRDDSGAWHDLAPFLYQRYDLAVTHSLCPDCGPLRRDR